MVVNLRGIQGNVAYRWYQLAQGTAEGHSVEYNQFIERFLHGTDTTPANTLGVEGSFYVNTDDSTLFFKQDNLDNDSSWIQIASGGGGGGGGSALEIYDGEDEISAAATRLTFTGGVTVTDTGDDDQVEIAIEENVDPTLTSNITVDTVQVIASPGDSTVDIAGAVAPTADTTGSAGVMTAADKMRLDDLNTYDLTATSGATSRINPSEFIFSNDGNSFRIATDTGGNLHTFTPTDPSTGDFAEQTIVLAGVVSVPCKNLSIN